MSKRAEVTCPPPSRAGVLSVLSPAPTRWHLGSLEQLVWGPVCQEQLNKGTGPSLVTEPRLQRQHGTNEGVSKSEYKGAMPKAGQGENSNTGIKVSDRR